MLVRWLLEACKSITGLRIVKIETVKFEMTETVKTLLSVRGMFQKKQINL